MEYDWCIVLLPQMTLTIGVQIFESFKKIIKFWTGHQLTLGCTFDPPKIAPINLEINIIWGSKTTHHIPLRLVMHLSSFQSTLQTNGKTTVTVPFFCLSVCCWWFFPIKCHLLKTLSETFHLWVTLLLFTDIKEVPSVCM